MGRLNDAEKYFELAISENPENANSLYNYGLFMEERETSRVLLLVTATRLNLKNNYIRFTNH